MLPDFPPDYSPPPPHGGQQSSIDEVRGLPATNMAAVVDSSGCSIFSGGSRGNVMTGSHLAAEVYNRGLPTHYDVQKSCEILNAQLPSLDWAAACNEYIFTNPKLRSSLEYYMSPDGFEEIDSAFENGLPLSPLVLSLQNSLLNAPPLDKTVMLYKGLTEDEYRASVVGGVFVSNGFLSVTVYTNVALDLADDPSDVLLRIEVPRGCSALFIGDVSADMSEAEVLLPHMSTCDILGTQNVAYLQGDSMPHDPSYSATPCAVVNKMTVMLRLNIKTTLLSQKRVFAN
jgi:hypothetical protein